MDVLKMNFPEVNETFTESTDLQYISEAVFAGGKASVAPIVEKIQKCKDILMDELKEIDESVDAHKKDENVKIKKFDPSAYWKRNEWRDLEDTIAEIFGFRYCEINPYREKYIAKDKIFESRELNCCVYHEDRYPIEGLVTDKGYYDKSHSSVMVIYVTLGLIRHLDADEITAVLLHEFGHSIDPALTTITYTETNILSKYLTDRKGAKIKLTEKEKKALRSRKFNPDLAIGLFYLIFLMVIGIVSVVPLIMEKIKGKEKVEEDRLKKIKTVLEKEKSLFNRKEFSEAFADNFARMYGYGAPLMRGLSKLSKDTEKQLNSWFKREREREIAITQMTVDALKDVHKTNIHRIRALLREYKEDINDPNTPEPVKKALKEDMEELEKVLDMYLNNFSEFQNKVNNLINDEITKLEEKEDKKASEEKKEEPIKESTEENFNEYYVVTWVYTWAVPVYVKKDILEGEDKEVIKRVGKKVKETRRPMRRAINESIRELNKERSFFKKLPLVNIYFTGKKTAIFPGLSIRKKIKERRGNQDLELFIMITTEVYAPLSREAETSLVNDFIDTIKSEVSDTDWLVMNKDDTFALVSSKEGKDNKDLLNFDNKIFDVEE